MKRVFLNFYLFIVFCLLFLQFAVNPFLQKAAEVYLHDSVVEYNRELSKGAFYLMQQDLLGFPQQKWKERIEELKPQFGYNISLYRLDELELNQQEIDQLKSGEIAVIADGDKLYSQIDNSGFILEKGPFGHLNPDTGMLSIWVYGIIIPALALITVAWIFPYWIKLKKIRLAATSFGDGDFESRVDISSHSSLYSIAHAFNNMAERIQSLIDSHKVLTNAVSHELRTPLSRLRFGVEMLNNADKTVKRKKYSAGLLQDIDALEELVSELLTYSKFDREQTKLTYNSYDIYGVLEHLCSHHTLSVPAMKWEVVSAINREIINPRADKKYMTRVLSNLVQNAVKYAESRFVITILRKENNCILFFDDDGEGIPENERNKVFEPFTRLDVSRSKKTGGYGLGLAIAKRIVHWHNGTISIENSPLGGARIRVCWPGFSD